MTWLSFKHFPWHSIITRGPCGSRPLQPWFKPKRNPAPVLAQSLKDRTPSVRLQTCLPKTNSIYPAFATSPSLAGHPVPSPPPPLGRCSNIPSDRVTPLPLRGRSRLRHGGAQTRGRVRQRPRQCGCGFLFARFVAHWSRHTKACCWSTPHTSWMVRHWPALSISFELQVKNVLSKLATHDTLKKFSSVVPHSRNPDRERIWHLQFSVISEDKHHLVLRVSTIHNCCAHSFGKRELCTCVTDTHCSKRSDLLTSRHVLASTYCMIFVCTSAATVRVCWQQGDKELALQPRIYVDTSGETAGCDGPWQCFSRFSHQLEMAWETWTNHCLGLPWWQSAFQVTFCTVQASFVGVLIQLDRSILQTWRQTLVFWDQYLALDLDLLEREVEAQHYWQVLSHQCGNLHHHFDFEQITTSNLTFCPRVLKIFKHDAIHTLPLPEATAYLSCMRTHTVYADPLSFSAHANHFYKSVTLWPLLPCWAFAFSSNRPSQSSDLCPESESVCCLVNLDGNCAARGWCCQSAAGWNCSFMTHKFDNLIDSRVFPGSSSTSVENVVTKYVLQNYTETIGRALPQWEKVRFARPCRVCCQNTSSHNKQNIRISPWLTRLCVWIWRGWGWGSTCCTWLLFHLTPLAAPSLSWNVTPNPSRQKRKAHHFVLIATNPSAPPTKTHQDAWTDIQREMVWWRLWFRTCVQKHKKSSQCLWHSCKPGGAGWPECISFAPRPRKFLSQHWTLTVIIINGTVLALSLVKC